MADFDVQRPARFTDQVTFTDTVQLPDATIKKEHVEASAGIEATKLQQQYRLGYAQAEGSDVVSETKPIDICLAGNVAIVAVEVCPITAPTGGDKQYTVDVEKSTGGGAFATVLSSVVTVSSSSTDRTVQAGTVSVTTAAQGDLFRVVVTASGSTGSQGQGLIVTLTIREDAEKS